MVIAETTFNSLKALDFFSKAEEQDLAAVHRLLKPRVWPAGALIFQRGDKGDGLIVLSKGAVRLSVDTPDGKQLTVRLVGPGEVFGEIALLDGGGRTADARTLEDSSGLVLAHQEFLGILARSPSLQQSVTHALCKRLRDTTEQLETIALWPLESRLARLFMIFARSRGGADAANIKRFEMKLSQSELASLIGASRPKVSAAFAELRRLGAVTQDGAMCACDMKLLGRIAGEGGLG